MVTWTTALTGPLVLPAAFVFRQDVPGLAGEALLTLGVLTLFLAICALDTIGTGPRETA